jgi:peptide methionine sulfoxide reductase MsrB
LQYKVTQENVTEPAFENECWDNKKGVIHLDIVFGESLFSLLEKAIQEPTGQVSSNRLNLIISLKKKTEVYL